MSAGFAPPRAHHDRTPATAVPATGVVDLRRAPDAAAELVSQLLFGEPLEVLDRSADGRFLQVRGPDGYAGWARALALATGERAAGEEWRAAATLRVARPWTWLADGGGPLPFLARVAPGPAPGAIAGPLGPLRPGRGGAGVRGFRTRLAAGSWAAQVRPLLGVPYLWGGRTPAGLDCSGFVQLVALARGIALPRDARDQCERLGGRAALRPLVGGPPLRRLDAGPAAAGRPGRPRPGDLLFFGPASGAITHVALSAGGLDAWHAYGWVRRARLAPGTPDFEPELASNLLGWNRLKENTTDSA